MLKHSESGICGEPLGVVTPRPEGAREGRVTRSREGAVTVTIVEGEGYPIESAASGRHINESKSDNRRIANLTIES